MLATYEIQYGRRLPSWICYRKSWDDARRPIDGGYGRENFVMIGVVLFMLQVFEFFVVHTWEDPILFMEPKFQFLGCLPKFRGTSFTPPKGTSLRGMTHF